MNKPKIENLHKNIKEELEQIEKEKGKAKYQGASDKYARCEYRKLNDVTSMLDVILGN